jgi:hypothetical protein
MAQKNRFSFTSREHANMRMMVMLEQECVVCNLIDCTCTVFQAPAGLLPIGNP